MSITYSGIEWDYDNLAGITYDSTTLDEPYATWFYQITGALEYEKDNQITIGDNGRNKVIFSCSERIINLHENPIREINYVKNDSITLSDESLRKFGILNSESITLSEESLRNFDSKKEEPSVYLLDECRYIKTTDSGSVIVNQVEISDGIVMFDFELSKTEWSESDFKDWIENNSPINYEELRPFIPGEYEYKDAYAGFRLSIPSTQGRFGVIGSTVYIDVEDTVEKGTVETPGGSLTRVNFSKRFYTSPHILTSLIYTGENCYVEVPTVTNEYFEFGLKSITSGNYIAGEISWLADGY